MKKFSKVKYFGAVAAALLAVAPVAAPVVSSIASPAVVEAATATQKATAKAVLDYTFGDSTTTIALLRRANFYNYTTAETPTRNDITSLHSAHKDNLIGTLLNGHDVEKLTSGNYKLKAEFAGYAGESAAELANDLPASGKSSFSVNLYLYDANNGEKLATKTVTLYLSDATTSVAASSVSVSGATTEVGSSIAPFTTTASFVNATQFNGAPATSANFDTFMVFTKSTSKVLPSAPNIDAPVAGISNGVFAKPGTYYALYSVNRASITISGNPTESVRSYNFGTVTSPNVVWYVARKIVVGDYAESSATGTAYVTNGQNATLYSDPTTATSTGKTLDFGSAWKVYGVVKNSAGTVLAYNLGGSQYVKASDVSSTPVSTQGGVFTVRYPANNKWSIAVYNSSLKVQKLIPAGSIWATFGTKTLNDGKSYYNVGGDQWVRTDYGYWNAK